MSPRCPNLVRQFGPPFPGKDHCSNLGFMFRSGREGLPHDETQAIQHLQRACDLGYRSICSLVHTP